MQLILPAVQLKDSHIDTDRGRLTVPGHDIPAKKIEIDLELINDLLMAARQAAQRAYAPYSQFHVGAAVVMADDPKKNIYPGSNIENSSYGATVCAERTGLLHCAALGFRRLQYLAVSTADALDKPLSERSPCGMCRQVIKEFTNKNVAIDDALILIDNGADETLCEIVDIERLLPYGFNFAGPQEAG